MSSHLVLMRTTPRLLPGFLAAYLRTMAGQDQIYRWGQKATKPELNTIEIRQFLIPVPTVDQQRELLMALDAARDARRNKLAQADALLAGVDGFVLDILGLTSPSPASYRTTYAVRALDVVNAKKLYPDYFHPERINAIRAVQSRYTGDRATTLLGVADFVRDQRTVKPGDDYLGLANVQPNTGERIESTEKDGEGTCFRYTEGDVLFARLRPYLNKVYRADRGGVCSTEFHVIRVRRDEKGRSRLVPDYLAAVMRSSLVLAQTRHMMTGNTHPRLANEDVVNLVVPVPERQVQDKVASEVARRREEGRLLRKAARVLWDKAKARFEEELLGPVSDPEVLKVGRNGERRKR
jgi:type I restriction enzyme S subunit